MPKTTLSIIGRAETIELVDFGNQRVIAKIDTGADISSIWATEITEKNGVLSFVLFGPESPHYTRQRVCLKSSDFRLTRIANSFGDREIRYVVDLRVRIHGRVIKATFSLADRRHKTYPILLGRRLLNRKFLVDVSRGRPLVAQEKEKRRKMHIELGQEEG